MKAIIEILILASLIALVFFGVASILGMNPTYGSVFAGVLVVLIIALLLGHTFEVKL